MKKYSVSKHFAGRENDWSCYEDDDLVLKNVSYGEMVNFQYKALEEAIEYGYIEKAEAFDLIDDRVSFNEFFDSICDTDEDEE